MKNGKFSPINWMLAVSILVLLMLTIMIVSGIAYKAENGYITVAEPAFGEPFVVEKPGVHSGLFVKTFQYPKTIQVHVPCKPEDYVSFRFKDNGAFFVEGDVSFAFPSDVGEMSKLHSYLKENYADRDTQLVFETFAQLAMRLAPMGMSFNYSINDYTNNPEQVTEELTQEFSKEVRAFLEHGFKAMEIPVSVLNVQMKFDPTDMLEVAVMEKRYSKEELKEHLTQLEEDADSLRKVLVYPLTAEEQIAGRQSLARLNLKIFYLQKAIGEVPQ